MVALNERIKMARKHANLTQIELSSRVGSSIRAFINYEKDASKVTVSLVQRIAHTCGVNEIWLLTGHGEMISDIENHKKAVNDDIIELEHKELVSKFKDKAKGKLYNEQLIELEQINEILFNDVGTYISATLNSAKVMRRNQEGRQVGKKAVNDK